MILLASLRNVAISVPTQQNEIEGATPVLPAFAGECLDDQVAFLISQAQKLSSKINVVETSLTYVPKCAQATRLHGSQKSEQTSLQHDSRSD